MIRRNNFLFSSWFMGALFIIFALTMAMATFVENDYGAAAARDVVYNAWWFELIFVLLAINFIGQIFRYKLYRPAKLTILVFHSAFIVIITGAGITRYMGQEGMMHLREGEAKSSFQSGNRYIHLNVTGANGQKVFSSKEPFVVTPLSVDTYEEQIKLDGRPYQLHFQKYLPNAQQTIVSAKEGNPLVKLNVSGQNTGAHSFILKPGQMKRIRDLKIGFYDGDNLDIRIDLQHDSFYVFSDTLINRLSMRNRNSRIFSKNTRVPLQPMYIYEFGSWRLVTQNLSKSGALKYGRGQAEMHVHRPNVLHFELLGNNSREDLYVRFNSDYSEPAFAEAGGHRFELDYQPQKISLPFQIKLQDFILERYPGSHSPSSFKSQVVVMDQEKSVDEEYMIYMNNVLKHRGYRFYQSSYDQDEKGSVLSVNHDPVGMHVTYAGYGLLFLFIVLSLLNKKAAFRSVHAGFWKLPLKKGAAIFLFILAFSSASLGNPEHKLVVNKKIANAFGGVLVQDNKGRTKPLYTLSHDVLRKIHRSNTYRDLNAMQVFLGLHYDFQRWRNEPLIKVSQSDLRDVLGLKGKYASIDQLVDMQHNTYRLRNDVQEAYSKPEAQRNRFDKEVIKVDERVNICFMIISGDLLRIFPFRDQSGKWGKPKQAVPYTKTQEDSLFVANVLHRIRQASVQNNISEAKRYIHSIKDYQRKYASYPLPSASKVKSEIIYYKSRIFERLFPFYAISGLLLLGLLMAAVIRGKRKQDFLIRILIRIIGIGFVFHLAGFVLRWYISGHAPMSNGYESMIFISWVLVLGGFLFSRKSKLTLAATAILAALTLMVAHLSFMDPEITNLVPVLQSFWLTLHVSVITSSYGFLGMAALLGLIVMVFYALINEGKHDRILSTIKDLSVINFKSLTLGLYLLTIGTFLGAIWANEAWGRYWGWDPKETWSLITIIVYSFVVHSRHIPGFQSLFAFNVLALFAFASVLMTYFGVNYYLTGLHSYAGGEPVPVPPFVYISVGLLLVLSFYAYWNRNRKLQLPWKDA